MAERKIFNPATLAPPVGHFDRAVQIGPYLYIAGTSALTHVAGGVMERKLPPSIEEQSRLTLKNIAKVIADAGLEMSDIFKITVFLVRPEDFEVVDSIIAEFLPDKGFINSTFVTALVNPDMLIEIEATAYSG